MKKLLSIILAIVYFAAAVPAACSMNNCEGECDGLKHVKTEDHHQASSGVFKLNPLSPATVTGGRYLTQGRFIEIISHSSPSAPVLAGSIPLFVRNCNFRI